MNKILVVMIALLVPALAVAADSIRVEGAASHAMVPGSKVGDGYLAIVNEGSESDRLLSARSPRADNVQLHKMVISNGIMTMREVKDGLPIPPHSTTRLDPDYHLMFNGVTEPFRKGEMIHAKLTFERAGEIDVQLRVGNIAGPLDEGGSQTPGSSNASPDGHSMHHQIRDDPATAVPGLLKTMFEAPGKPLAVNPVVSEDEWAIAGWQQDGRGGRALLQKSHHGWQVHALGGKSFATAAGLEEAGVRREIAARLARKLSQEEEHLGKEAAALQDSFEGTIRLAETPAEAGRKPHEGH